MSNTGDDILNACKHLWKAGGHMARAGGSILNAIFDDSNCSCPYCGKRYNLKDGYYKCSCEKCFRKTGDKTLTDDETVNDVIADIIKILAILSKADGRVTHAEIEIIKEFLREHDLNKNQFIWCVDLFNDFRHNAYSSLYIDKIKKFCDSVAIEYFLKLLSKLAEVDGGISKEQYYLIHQILNDLSISIDFYNQVTNVKLNENNKYSSKKSKNTIRCPKCNTEYNLTDGYYNCECSEEIRVLNGEVCEKGKYVNQIIDAAVCLAAYISKADGQVTDNEIAVLRRFLQELKLNGDEIKYCAIRFNQCKSEQFNNEIIYDLVDSYEPKGYELPLFLMISMALADGEISKGQDCIISEFMRITKLPLSLYEAMKHELEGDSELNLDESYKILGISKEASPEEIKKAYKHLLKIYHPDMQSSKGLHEEIMKDLRKKFDEIQAAYDNIKKVKNFQ